MLISKPWRGRIQAEGSRSEKANTEKMVKNVELNEKGCRRRGTQPLNYGSDAASTYFDEACATRSARRASWKTSRIHAAKSFLDGERWW